MDCQSGYHRHVTAPSPAISIEYSSRDAGGSLTLLLKQHYLFVPKSCETNLQPPHPREFRLRQSECEKCFGTARLLFRFATDQIHDENRLLATAKPPFLHMLLPLSYLRPK